MNFQKRPQTQNFIQESLAIVSATGQGLLQADLYKPAGEPRFGLLIIHGMAEHRRRYAEFAQWIAERGAVVVAYDLAGHGESAPDLEHLGFFADAGGSELVICDIDQMVTQFRELFPLLPLVLLGHSMGSLIVRDYLTTTNQPLAGVILTGTSGPNPALQLGRWLAKRAQQKYGPKHRSKLLDRLLHLGFSSRVPHPHTEFDWLTRDEQIVSDYIADSDCGFVFTVSGMLDMMAWTEKNQPIGLGSPSTSRPAVADRFG